MIPNEPLYLAPETLYRLGNATSPLLTRMRTSDIDIVEINGIKVVIANHKGVSLYNKQGLDLAPVTGWVWEISAHTSVPPGLNLTKDNNPMGHYTLSPVRNMPVHEFLGLLEKVAIHCRKVFKKNA